MPPPPPPPRPALSLQRRRAGLCGAAVVEAGRHLILLAGGRTKNLSSSNACSMRMKAHSRSASVGAVCHGRLWLVKMATAGLVTRARSEIAPSTCRDRARCGEGQDRAEQLEVSPNLRELRGCRRQ